jgi:DNA-directed RNA polymerase specialized sigma24 family protein
LTLLEGLPAGAIAERLGISRDNVYARRSRGLREFKRILRDDGA